MGREAVCLGGTRALEALDILEVVVRTDLELDAGSFVTDDDALGVELQSSDRPHLVHTAFDGLLQGTSLAVTVDEDQYLTGSHDGTDTDGEGGLRHLVHVAIEEAAVGDDGVGGEGLHTGA